jgi:hypothetical protein
MNYTEQEVAHKGTWTKQDGNDIVYAKQQLPVVVRGCPVNTPSQRPQMQSIHAMSLPDMTFATTCDFTQSVHSVSDE